jgi:chromosome segregation ATPase
MSDGMAKSSEDLKNYREVLLVEKEALRKDIDDLENSNYEFRKQIKEMEIQLLQKNKAIRELSSSLHEIKKSLVRFVTEESNLTSEIDLLETEKGRIIATYNEISHECGDNISNLGNTILKIDFIKGEIEALRSKIGMTEKEAGEDLRELDSLEEKFSWASKAFTGLYDSIKDIEKRAKIKYYTKE